MIRLVIALCATVSTLTLSACAGGYGFGGGGYGGGPYSYDGFYDDHYGAIYDGYWGSDGGFYYRGGAHDRRFRRGDSAHFNRGGSPGPRFHPMQGSMTPGRGVRMPHFDRGGRGVGQGRGGRGGRGHR